MTAHRWFWTTLGGFALLVALYTAVTLSLDVFGTFRNPKGRSLPAYGLYNSRSDDRTSKYLLSQHYVPANFNGLILGTSNVANYPVDHAADLRFYNEAVSAASATEMRILCTQALKHGRYKVALVELFPSLTQTHDVKEGLNDSRPSDAFGSINSISSEAYAILVRLHLMRTPFFPNGAKDMMVPLTPTPEILVPLTGVDPVAVRDYVAMLQDLTSRGTRIVYVVPPVYRPAYLRHQGEIDQYVSTMLPVIPSGRVLDLNDPRYAWFTSNPSNFADALHLNMAGARRMGELLDGLLPQFVASSSNLQAATAGSR